MIENRKYFMEISGHGSLTALGRAWYDELPIQQSYTAYSVVAGLTGGVWGDERLLAVIIAKFAKYNLKHVSFNPLLRARDERKVFKSA